MWVRLQFTSALLVFTGDKYTRKSWLSGVIRHQQDFLSTNFVRIPGFCYTVFTPNCIRHYHVFCKLVSVDSALYWSLGSQTLRWWIHRDSELTGNEFPSKFNATDNSRKNFENSRNHYGNKPCIFLQRNEVNWACPACFISKTNRFQEGKNFSVEMERFVVF